MTRPSLIYLESPYKISTIYEVFDPGAAHMSSTKSEGFIYKKITGNIETNSCLYKYPH